MNSNLNKFPDPHDASKCDLCGQRKQSVRPRTLVTVGRESGIVRTKFCDACAAIATEWLNGEKTNGSPPEKTVALALDRPLTPAEGEQVTRHLVEDAVERDLPSLLEKYRVIQKQSGRRVQVCITDYDESTYDFLHLGTKWTHGFWRMVNQATARRVREEGFFVRFVSLDLNHYMEWLAGENLHDSSTARERFAAAIADREMGIAPTAPTREYNTLVKHLAESTPDSNQQSKDSRKQEQLKRLAELTAKALDQPFARKAWAKDSKPQPKSESNVMKTLLHRIVELLGLWRLELRMFAWRTIARACRWPRIHLPSSSELSVKERERQWRFENGDWP